MFKQCIVHENVQTGYLKNMFKKLISAANISVASLGMDCAKDNIPLLSPAGDQARRAYLCRKRLMLAFLVSDEDFAKISMALRGDNSAAMDDIPFFSTAGAKVWRAYHYLKDQYIGDQHGHCDCQL
jgi:hypothetical protein